MKQKYKKIVWCCPDCKRKQTSVPSKFYKCQHCGKVLPANQMKKHIWFTLTN